ncbi:MAG: hypothetical protein HY908_14370 [Myxococcales bacterium]|nr:hypothetical protein [Myxococcales bacterium]
MRRLALCLPVLAALGCGTGSTSYTPSVLAAGELTLRYHDAVEVWSPTGKVAEGARFAGLADEVACVPDALRHAEAAETYGQTGAGLTIAGATLAVVGLGGLGGLAFYGKDDTALAAMLGAGVASEVLGLVLAAVGRSMKNDANGHAVDAVNYYDDAVGSVGNRCRGSAVERAPLPPNAVPLGDPSAPEPPPAPTLAPPPAPSPAPTPTPQPR